MFPAGKYWHFLLYCNIATVAQDYTVFLKLPPFNLNKHQQTPTFLNWQLAYSHWHTEDQRQGITYGIDCIMLATVFRMFKNKFQFQTDFRTVKFTQFHPSQTNIPQWPNCWCLLGQCGSSHKRVAGEEGRLPWETCHHIHGQGLLLSLRTLHTSRPGTPNIIHKQ